MSSFRLAFCRLSSLPLLLALASPVAATQTVSAPSEPLTAGLARYGRWQTVEPFGRVWFPRVEGVWRPYSRGSWTRADGSGWSWQGRDPWSVPTEHGGRWATTHGAWFWIPGPPLREPPVAWAIAPDYVGWCPLDPHDRPAEPLAPGSRSRAWTMVRRADFGAPDSFAAELDLATLPRTIPFIVQRPGPAAESPSLTVASRQPLMPAQPAPERSSVVASEPAASPAATTPEFETDEAEPYFWGLGVPTLAPRHRRPRVTDPYAPHFEPHFQPHYEPHYTPGFGGFRNGMRHERPAGGHHGGTQAPPHQSPPHPAAIHLTP
ncbi:MAG: DUF6600 domain-containing protein [Betaproteobacteria bacterium]